MGKTIWRKRLIIVMSLVLCTTSCNLPFLNKDEENEPITFVFYNTDGQEDPWSDPIAKEITKATGVTLKSDYPVDGNDKRIDLMIATGEYPDIIFAKGDSVKLIEHNSLIDLSDLIDEYGPNIKELYGKELNRFRYSEEDPSIYQLCCSPVQNEIIDTSGTAQLQWSVIIANDYKIPKTLKQYEDMIRDYMKKHKKTGDKDTIGITISCSDWHWYTTLSNPSGYIANGSPDNGQWIIDEDYTAHYKHAAKRQKEFYQWMNKMYHEGILDPEFATQTHEDYLEKIASGRVLGLFDQKWDFKSAEQALEMEGLYEKTYAGLPVTIDESVLCASLEKQGMAVGWGVGITKSCKDPVRAIKFLDWLCTKEAQVLINWGIEGVNYQYDENGTRVQMPEDIKLEESSPDYNEITGIGLHGYPFPTYGSEAKDDSGNYISRINKDTVPQNYNVVEKMVLSKLNLKSLTEIFPNADKFPEPMYAPAWSQTFHSGIQEKVNKLDKISWDMLIKCIMCKPEKFDDTWDAFQQQLEEADLKDVEQEVTRLIKRQVRFWSKEKKEE